MAVTKIQFAQLIRIACGTDVHQHLMAKDRLYVQSFFLNKKFFGY